MYAPLIIIKHIDILFVLNILYHHPVKEYHTILQPHTTLFIGKKIPSYTSPLLRKRYPHGTWDNCTKNMNTCRVSNY